MARRAGRFARIGLDYADHPKIARLSDAAFRAHMTMILYARRFTTDGRIPKQFAKQFAEQTLEELLTYDAGKPLLTQDGPDGDYWLHDFADWQETRAEIEEKSQVRRVAGAKGGRVRSQNAKQIAKQNVEQIAKQTDSNLSSKTQAEKEKEIEIVVSSPSGLLTATPPSPPKPEPKSARNHRPPDPLFDAVTAVCGIDPETLTATGRGAINASLKQLRDVHATPEQVRVRGSTYRQRFAGAALTAPALAKHWASLGANHPGDPWSPPPGSPLSYVEM